MTQSIPKNYSLLKVIVFALVLISGILVVAQAGKPFGFIKSGHERKDEMSVALEAIKTDENPWDALTNIQLAFSNGNNIYCSGTIGLREDDNASLLEKVPFSYEWNSGNFHYRIDSVEMIQANGLVLNIYHRDKMLTAGKGKAVQNLWWSYTNLDSLKAYTERNGAAVSVWKNGEQKFVKIEQLNNSEVYEIDVFFSTSDFRVLKMIYHLATPEELGNSGAEDLGVSDPDFTEDNDNETIAEDEQNGRPIVFNLYQMEVQYDKFIVGPQKVNFNPEEKFITRHKGKFALTETYKNFKVIAAQP